MKGKYDENQNRIKLDAHAKFRQAENQEKQISFFTRRPLTLKLRFTMRPLFISLNNSKFNFNYKFEVRIKTHLSNSFQTILGNDGDEQNL